MQNLTFFECSDTI